MPDKVVDSSAICALVYVEPDGLTIASRITGHGLYAPSLLTFEVANVCVTKLRQNTADPLLLRAQFAHFEAMQIVVSEIDAHRVVSLAERAGLSFYDASYLWLAQDLGLELVTLDKRLAAAAGKMGVKT